MLTITDIGGNTEALTGYRGLRRKRNVNGEKTLAFLIMPTEQNAHSYPMVSEESIVEFDGEPYRIKQLAEKSKGTKFYKEVVAVHTFFDLIDDHIYALHTGSMTFQAALQFVLDGTEYTWSIVDTFYAQDFENFGDQNRLALFQTLLERYDAEFTLNGTHLTFRERIGNATDFQFRYNYNVKTIMRDVKTSNLSTYIKGYGKQNDDGTYVVESEYTSPNSSVFGIRHAKPVRDERYTTLEGLTARLQAELIDEPEVSITIDFADLRRAGFPYDVPSEGDDVFLIYEPIGIDVEARLVDIDEEFTEDSDLPLKTTVTLGNIRDSVVDRWANTEKQVSGIVNSDGKIRYNALDAAVIRATESLQSAQTELEFENGIIARSKVNPNDIVLLNSNGVGISRDGGQTFKEAITSAGFVLSAGAIGQLSANNIQIGPDTTFETGYNPTDKVTYDEYTQEIANIKNQLDGKVESWFYDYDPTTTNEPASLWTTTLDKDAHIGDTFTNINNGYSWRYLFKDGIYQWVRIADTDAQQALEEASRAQDTADGKRRVFVIEPVPPYDIGDLWVQGTTGEIMVCAVAKASGTYTATDWVKASKYTDDTAVNNLVIGGRNLIQKSKGDSLSGWVAWAANTTQIYTENGINWIKVNRTAANPQAGIQTPVFDMKANVTYCISFKIKNLPNAGLELNYLYLRQSNPTLTSVKTLPKVSLAPTGGNWVGDLNGEEGLRVYFTFSHNADVKNARILIGVVGIADGDGFGIKEIMVEEGTKPTSWTPNENDIVAEAKTYADTLKQLVDNDITETNQAISDLDTYVDGSFKDGVISEAEAKSIEKYINQVNTEKADIDSRYNVVYPTIELNSTTEKTALATAKTNYNTAHTNLINSINMAISDGQTTSIEKTDVDSKFTTYKTRLSELSTAFENAVNRIAQEKSDKAVEGIRDGDEFIVNTKQLILNSTFTTGADGKGNWTSWKNSWTNTKLGGTSRTLNGVNTAKCTVTGLTEDEWREIKTNRIKTAGGRTYALSVYTQVDDLTTFDRGFSAEFEWWDAAGTRIGTRSLNILPTQNGVWERKTTTATAPAGTVDFNIRFHPNRNGIGWIAKPMLTEGTLFVPHAEASDAADTVRDDLRLSAPLPTSLTLDQSGIRASTSDVTRYAQLDYRGLFVRKGAVQIERPDGALFVEDGLVRMDFAIQTTSPPDLINTTLANRHFASSRTTSQNDGFIGLYTFRRQARYLEFEIALSSSTVSYAALFKVVQSGNTSNVLGTVQSFDPLGQESVRKLRIDLGTPDFTEYAVNAMLLHNFSGAAAYCRIIRVRQTDF